MTWRRRSRGKSRCSGGSVGSGAVGFLLVAMCSICLLLLPVSTTASKGKRTAETEKDRDAKLRRIHALYMISWNTSNRGLKHCLLYNVYAHCSSKVIFGGRVSSFLSSYATKSCSTTDMCCWRFGVCDNNMTMALRYPGIGVISLPRLALYAQDPAASAIFPWTDEEFVKLIVKAHNRALPFMGQIRVQGGPTWQFHHTFTALKVVLFFSLSNDWWSFTYLSSTRKWQHKCPTIVDRQEYFFCCRKFLWRNWTCTSREQTGHSKYHPVTILCSWFGVIPSWDFSCIATSAFRKS